MSQMRVSDTATTCHDCGTDRVIWLLCDDGKSRPFDPVPREPDGDLVWGWSRRCRAMRRGAPVRGLSVHRCRAGRERWEADRLEAMRISDLDEVMRGSHSQRGSAR